MYGFPNPNAGPSGYNSGNRQRPGSSSQRSSSSPSIRSEGSRADSRAREQTPLGSFNLPIRQPSREGGRSLISQPAASSRGSSLGSSIDALERGRAASSYHAGYQSARDYANAMSNDRARPELGRQHTGYTTLSSHTSDSYGGHQRPGPYGEYEPHPNTEAWLDE